MKGAERGGNGHHGSARFKKSTAIEHEFSPA
jgi:hypothetical protein